MKTILEMSVPMSGYKEHSESANKFSSELLLVPDFPLSAPHPHSALETNSPRLSQASQLSTHSRPPVRTPAPPLTHSLPGLPPVWAHLVPAIVCLSTTWPVIARTKKSGSFSDPLEQ